jgi:hypothetical protein
MAYRIAIEDDHVGISLPLYALRKAVQVADEADGGDELALITFTFRLTDADLQGDPRE